MLVYHPAFDNYHCMLRLLKILDNIPLIEYSYDRLKIYDYYFLFPQELKEVTLPLTFKKYKLIRKENKFNKVHNSIEVFRRISGFQYLALNALASFGLIDNNLFQEKIILRTNIVFQLDLELTEEEKSYIDFLNIYANKISLKELKQRTKLMEYRYELS